MSETGKHFLTLAFFGALMTWGMGNAVAAEPGKVTMTTGQGKTMTLTMQTLENARGYLYCELVFTYGKEGNDIYSTSPLSPAELDWWKHLDLEALAKEFGAKSVVRNGPQWWSMDEVGVMASQPVPVAGVNMVFGAHLPPNTLAIPKYTVFNPAKYQNLTWKAGKPVYQLLDPDGHVYVLQGYKIPADKLATLGEKFSALPAGWRYRVKVLDKDLVMNLTPDKPIPSVQDEFDQIYIRIPKPPSSSNQGDERAADHPTPEDDADNRSGIREADAAYVKAFNAQDAKALAALWSPDAVYTNRITGEQVTGRGAIEKQFAAIFDANKQVKMEVAVESIQLLSPNAAVEHGRARLITPDGLPELIEYTAVFVRQDGKWLLDNVTDESSRVETPTQYEHLKELEWIIGSWVDEDDTARIITECQWTRNNNFISRSCTVESDGAIDMAGMQVIGWDARSKQIRSWTFDSDGGFSEDVWTKQDRNWFIRKNGTTADGRRVTAVNILKYVNDDTCTVQSVDRAVDGELLPNSDEVRVVRVK